MADINLNGFDMVWGVTQNAVNSQFQWLFETGAISSHVQFGDITNDGVAVDGMLAPPVVSFNTGTGKRARMTLTFASGTATYWEGFGPTAKQKTADLKGWKIALIVNLNLGALAADRRSAPSQASMSKETLAILQNFSDSMFSINSIFLDLQNADLVDFDAVSSTTFPDADPKNPSLIAPVLRQQFADGIRAWITTHKGAGNPYVLGYAVLKKSTNQTDSVLHATGATFSTQAYKYAPAVPHSALSDGMSTLNFLLVCDNRNIAADPRLSGEAAGIFGRNLVAANDVDGTLIISKDVFTRKYIQPFIIARLRARLQAFDPNFIHGWANHQPSVRQDLPPQDFTPDATGMVWTWVSAPGLYWDEHDMLEREALEENRHTTAVVSILNNPDGRLGMHVAGTLFRRHKRTHYTSGSYVRDSWVQTTVAWHIDLTFVAGVDGKINITTTGATSPAIHDHGDGGLDSFADFFKGVLGIEQDWDKFFSAYQGDPATIQEFISNFSKMINATEMVPILPAPKVAFYKNIHLNSDNNIQVDLTYKTQ